MRRRRHIGVRLKMSLGFAILAAMLFISDALAIRELSQIGREVRSILDDSYRSVEYGQGMLNELGMQQMAILQHLTGDEADARDQLADFKRAEVSFRHQLALAKSNLKHEGESLMTDSIAQSFEIYVAGALRILTEKGPVGAECTEHLRSVVVQLRRQLNGLVLLNQEALYSTVHLLEDSTRRAIRPGILVIVVGILFIFLFTYLINHYFVSPVVGITASIRQYLKLGRYKAYPTASNDELEELRDAVDQLVQHDQHGRTGQPLP